MVVVARDDNIQIEKLELRPFGTNAYVVTCQQTQDSVLVDAPGEPSTIVAKMKGTNPRYLLLTHNHRDHIGALSELQSNLKIPLAVHAADSGHLPSAPDRLLNDGDRVLCGNISLEVLHTPGHTPGSLCFKAGPYLISGDTIFTAGPGKTRSPEALRQIIESITKKIFVLPDDTQIHPGHGPSTVVKKEKDEFAIFSSKLHDPGLCGDVLWLSS